MARPTSTLAPRSNLCRVRWSCVALVAACLLGSTVRADDGVITTTHEVLLKNGQRLLGNLSDESDDTTVVLTFGERGELRIPRSRVEETRPREGRVTVVTKDSSSEPEVEKGAELPGEPTEPKKAATEETSTRNPTTAESAAEAKPELTAERQAEIAEAIRELGRWRSRNRVRAERQLAAIGPDAVEALLPLATNHPFDLTRRAVFRLFNQWNDERTLPSAIIALGDEDRFVRESAAQLLRDTTGRRFGYRFDAHERHRAKRALRWAEYLLAREEERSAAAAAPTVPTEPQALR